jgi:glycerol transport system ATP-binding protein
MNFLNIRKSADRIHFGDGQAAPVGGSLGTLPDGNYIAGFRPNHLELERQTGAAMEFQAGLIVTELTGSETFVHLDHHGERWVGLVHGIRDLEIGKTLSVYLDPSHVYIFAEDGALVAPATYALAKAAA